MREELIEKIEGFYNHRLKIIDNCLSDAARLVFNVRMIGVDLDMKGKTGIIKLDESSGFNSSLIIPEIFEDLSCSFDLLKQGYFKNSKQVLRNTLELLMQLLYNNILISRNEQHTSNWLTRQRGVENIYGIIKILLGKLKLDQRQRIAEIGKFYNLLNAATHSHKNQLNITKTDRIDGFAVHGFEHTEVVNCLLLHAFCFSTIIHFITDFYRSINSDDHLLKEIIVKLEEISSKLSYFNTAIENYKKGDYEKGEGFLIFKKNVVINNIGILYSYRANYTIAYHSRNKVKQSDWKLIDREIDNELIKIS